MIRYALMVVVLVAAFGARAADAPIVNGFHHVRMNVVDPDRSIAFYTKVFERTKKTTVAGIPGVKSEGIYILFNKVAKPASAEWDTSLWHFGWNTADLEGDYKKMVGKGVEFFRKPSGFSAHLIGPDRNDIEIAVVGAGSGGNGSNTFNHVHTQSDAPLCAAKWFRDVLGLVANPRTTIPDDCVVAFGPRGDPANQVLQPSARLYAGEILISIFPYQRLAALKATVMENDLPLAPTRGRVLDHIAFTTADLPAAMARLKAQGVRTIEDIHPFGDTKAAMIEGPDHMAIELVEGKAGPAAKF